jgi:hypothetical protein
MSANPRWCGTTPMVAVEHATREAPPQRRRCWHRPRPPFGVSQSHVASSSCVVVSSCDIIASCMLIEILMLVGKSSIIAIALANLHAEVLMLIVLDFLHISLLLFVKENFWICSSVCAYLLIYKNRTIFSTFVITYSTPTLSFEWKKMCL